MNKKIEGCYFVGERTQRCAVDKNISSCSFPVNFEFKTIGREGDGKIKEIDLRSPDLNGELYGGIETIQEISFASVRATRSSPSLTYLLKNLHQPAHTATYLSSSSSSFSNTFCTPTYVDPSIFPKDPPPQHYPSS